MTYDYIGHKLCHSLFPPLIHDHFQGRRQREEGQGRTKSPPGSRELGGRSLREPEEHRVELQGAGRRKRRQEELRMAE